MTGRRVLLLAVVLAGGLAVAACGSASAPASQGTATAPTTLAKAAGTATPSSATAVQGAVDLCSVVTIAMVQETTKIAPAIRAQAAAGCQYQGPGGLLVSVQQAKLQKADQATFDAYVKAQESSETTKVPGLGEGDGASAKHDVNVTVYARKGLTAVAATVFNGAADPASNARTIAEKALTAY